MIDDYLHSWKAERGYYDVAPPYWWNDDKCDWYENEERLWRESLRDLPSTDYGWRKLFGILPPPAPGRAARLDRDEIRERADFRAIIEETMKFKARGDRVVGLCPFHQERTPSFNADLKKKVFICRGCYAKGDLFTFVQLRDNVTFVEAMKIIAKMC